jgi:hypothetical protein
MNTHSFKLTVCFEKRPDGGLRAWSDDVPGLVLSHIDADSVLEDVPQALKLILSHQWNTETDVQLLGDIREALENRGVVAPKGFVPVLQEYVATRG